LSSLRFRCYKKGDEVKIVELLNLAFEDWGSVERWTTKYMLSPGFDPNLIHLSEENERLVGCLHSLKRDVRIGRNILTGFLGSEGATLPNYRGRGVYYQLFLRLYKEEKKRNGIVHYGFMHPMLYKTFYGGKLGEIALCQPQAFLKVLNPDKVAQPLVSVANRIIGKKLRTILGKNEAYSIRIEVNRTQAINLTITRSGIQLHDKLTTRDATIRTDANTFIKTTLRPSNLITAFIFRKMRIQASLGTLVKLFRLAVRILW